MVCITGREITAYRFDIRRYYCVCVMYADVCAEITDKNVTSVYGRFSTARCSTIWSRRSDNPGAGGERPIFLLT